MENAKSETVRLRAAEFLVGDGKAPQVSVTVDARPSAGYAYIRPGQQVVDITPEAPTPSADTIER